MKISRPSPSMAVALVALFVALGGTGFAATKLVVKTSPQVGTGTIVSRAIKDGQIGEQDLNSRLKAQLGTSSGREVIRKAGPDAKAGPSEIVVLKGLAPGAYAIFAKTTLSAVPQTGLFGRTSEASSGACTLEAGGDVDDARHAVLLPNTDTPSTINLQLTRTLGAAADIKLNCSVSQVDWRASDSSIIAVKLGSVSRDTVSG